MSKKRIVIDGMNCSHCSSRIENALNAMESVKAKVNLKKKIAEVKADDSVTNEMLRSVIEDLGFCVVEIE